MNLVYSNIHWYISYMAPAVEFSTVIEMFCNLTGKFSHDNRPILMYKVEGQYKNISYGDLRNTVEQFACGLATLGVQRGDHIALISENRPEWVVADMGMMMIGAVNVSIYPTLTPKQIEFILNDAGVKYAVVSNTLQLSKVLKVADDISSLKNIVIISNRGVQEDRRVTSYAHLLSDGTEFGKVHPGFLETEMRKTAPEDLLTIIYTSGTTGNPKGVMLTHKNLVSNMKSSASCIPFTPEDTVLSFLPLCHSYERMGGYYTAMSCGATIAYAESIDTVRENLLEVRPTAMPTVPRLFERMYNRIMKQVDESSFIKQKIFRWAVGVGCEYTRKKQSGTVSPFLSIQQKIADRLVFRSIKERIGGRMRFFVSGGAALAPELGEFFDAVGLMVIEGYGMTESSPAICVNRLDEYKFGTVGKPIPGVEVRIAGDGEILIKGPNVMKGYWNNPQATAEVIDVDGWLHTGDIGMFDEEGFLTITDRKKNIFVSSGGKNIAPQHIENLFMQSPLIEQCVLIGDGRMFLTALIVPNFDALKEYALKHNLRFSSQEELLILPEIYQHIEQEVAQVQQHLSSFERVRKFTILSKPFTIEDGEITPTMKVRRKIVEEEFKGLIEKMYEGLE
jgi:long-chain acyl-CoA synthetase